jgi:lysophospholipase L1-like esterase
VPPVGVRRRILFLGDSFTEGVGVPNDKTFVHIIGDRIRRAGGNIEVMNGGVASHSPRLYLLHLQDLVERKGAKFDEVVVFIDESDIQDELIYQGFTPGRVTPSLIIRYVKEYVEQNSLFAYVLFNRLPFLSRFFDLLRFEMRGQSSGQLAHESWDRPNYYKIRDAWVDDDKAFRAWGAYGLKLAHENLSRLAAYAATKGMTISFAIYPWPRHARQIHSRARDVWEKIARKENWTLIDLFPDFTELADPRRLYIRGDVHWNADGHRFVAEHWLAHYCELRHSNWCARLEPPVRSDSARRGQNENSINDVIQ